MGAWGLNNFENDDALDWTDELLRGDGLDPILAAFSEISESDYVEAPESCAALAAAEVVAALSGNPGKNLPNDVAAWVSSHSFQATSELVKVARTKVEKIRNASELKELIEDTGRLDEWYTIIDDLIFRLS